METVKSQETVYLGIKNRIALGTFTVRGGLYYVQRLEERQRDFVKTEKWILSGSALAPLVPVGAVE